MLFEWGNRVLRTEQLDDRSKEIFRRIVEVYIATGQPVGSKTLSARLALRLSPATIRCVMVELEGVGQLFSPYPSRGLRLFIDKFLEHGKLTAEERRQLDMHCQISGGNLVQILKQVTLTLSRLAQCAGFVVDVPTETRFRHVL